MGVTLPQIEELPRRNATHVKNRWGALVREVRALGSVAVTSHDKIEIVVLASATYREMAKLVRGAAERRRAALGELADAFDRHLAALKAPDAKKRVASAMAAKGRAKRRSKAGVSF
jgi:hypothetical protein